MRSALRKMGNSTGIILPAPVLRAAGLAIGAELELAVDQGRIIATPVTSPARHGWADAAATLTPTAEEQDWTAAPLSTDADLAW